MVKFATDASGATWWPNLEPMQVVLPGAKFASNAIGASCWQSFHIGCEIVSQCIHFEASLLKPPHHCSVWDFKTIPIHWTVSTGQQKVQIIYTFQPIPKQSAHSICCALKWFTSIFTGLNANILKHDWKTSFVFAFTEPWKHLKTCNTELNLVNGQWP